MQQAYSYLAGIIDGEGSVYYNEAARSRYLVALTTTELDLLFACKEILDAMEIRYCIVVQKGQKVNHSTVYHVRVQNRDGMQKIYDSIPLRSRRKRKKLKKILGSYVETQVVT